MTTVFDLAFAIAIIPALLRGLSLTIQATVYGFTLAIVLGFVLFLARSADLAILSNGARSIVEFIRSTPLLVQLYFAYFGLPNIGITLEPLMAGSLVLGIHYSCYISEVYRAALQGVAPGQREAARSLGLSPTQGMRLVIIPQMFPLLIPGLGNYLIALFKETPALSAITVAEMLFTAKIVGAENFRYLEPMTFSGLAFLILSIVCAAGVRLLERRLRWTFEPSGSRALPGRNYRS